MSAPKHIPGEQQAGWLQRKSVVELVSSGPPVLAAGVAAFFSPTPAHRWALGIGAVWLALASIIKVLHAREQDKVARRQSDYDGLTGALQVLHATVADRCGISDAEADQKLRVTIHRVVPNSEKGKDAEFIEQVVPYIGGSGDGSGRRFSIRSGITGQAIRSKQPCAGARQNNDDAKYHHELRTLWSYTDTEARNLCPGRHSFMAVPIRSGQHVVGVVLLGLRRTRSVHRHRNR